MDETVMATPFDADPVRAEHFMQPIEFLYYTHARIQNCCERLVELGDDLGRDDAPDLAAASLDLLENELPMHLADEENDLFPLLRRRSKSGDGIMGTLELLCLEHRNDIECGRSLVDALRRISRGRRPADPRMFRDYVRAYAMLQRRHHIIENNEVLPVCIERLTAEDLRELGNRIAARRGVSIPDR